MEAAGDSAMEAGGGAAAAGCAGAGALGNSVGVEQDTNIKAQNEMKGTREPTFLMIILQV